MYKYIQNNAKKIIYILYTNFNITYYTQMHLIHYINVTYNNVLNLSICSIIQLYLHFSTYLL